MQVGNGRAEVAADVAADGRSLTFGIPRTATSGPVTILPTTGATYQTTNSLQVRSVRNQDGFAFANYSYGWLSYGELTDLVGQRDMFIEVNPCWPFGNCSIPTGVPDPVAYLVWGVLNIALKASGGHCFGINRTLQELLAGKVRHSRFAPGVTINHDLPAAAGPNDALGTWLDGRHAGQGTAEFLVGYLGRERDLPNQLSVIRAELGRTVPGDLTEERVERPCGHRVRRRGSAGRFGVGVRLRQQRAFRCLRRPEQQRSPLPGDRSRDHPHRRCEEQVGIPHGQQHVEWWWGRFLHDPAEPHPG